MRIFMAFLAWLSQSTREGIRLKHEQFRYSLRRDTALTTLGFIVLGLCATIPVALIILAIFTPPYGWPVMLLWFASLGVYYVYVGFSILFERFKAERAHLFTVIRDSHD